MAPVVLNVYDLTNHNAYTYWCGVGIFHAGASAGSTVEVGARGARVLCNLQRCRAPPRRPVTGARVRAQEWRCMAPSTPTEVRQPVGGGRCAQGTRGRAPLCVPSPQLQCTRWCAHESVQATSSTTRASLPPALRTRQGKVTSGCRRQPAVQHVQRTGVQEGAAHQGFRVLSAWRAR